MLLRSFEDLSDSNSKHWVPPDPTKPHAIDDNFTTRKRPQKILDSVNGNDIVSVTGNIPLVRGRQADRVRGHKVLVPGGQEFSKSYGFISFAFPASFESRGFKPKS